MTYRYEVKAFEHYTGKLLYHFTTEMEPKNLRKLLKDSLLDHYAVHYYASDIDTGYSLGGHWVS
jgi:hypothetical protein